MSEHIPNMDEVLVHVGLIPYQRFAVWIGEIPKNTVFWFPCPSNVPTMSMAMRYIFMPSDVSVPRKDLKFLTFRTTPPDASSQGEKLGVCQSPFGVGWMDCRVPLPMQKRGDFYVSEPGAGCNGFCANVPGTLRVQFYHAPRCSVSKSRQTLTGQPPWACLQEETPSNVDSMFDLSDSSDDGGVASQAEEGSSAAPAPAATSAPSSGASKASSSRKRARTQKPASAPKELVAPQPYVPPRDCTLSDEDSAMYDALCDYDEENKAVVQPTAPCYASFIAEVKRFVDTELPFLPTLTQLLTAFAFILQSRFDWPANEEGFKVVKLHQHMARMMVDFLAKRGFPSPSGPVETLPRVLIESYPKSVLFYSVPREEATWLQVLANSTEGNEFVHIWQLHVLWATNFGAEGWKERARALLAQSDAPSEFTDEVRVLMKNAGSHGKKAAPGPSEPAKAHEGEAPATQREVPKQKRVASTAPREVPKRKRVVQQPAPHAEDSTPEPESPRNVVGETGDGDTPDDGSSTPEFHIRLAQKNPSDPPIYAPGVYPIGFKRSPTAAELGCESDDEDDGEEEGEDSPAPTPAKRARLASVATEEPIHGSRGARNPVATESPSGVDESSSDVWVSDPEDVDDDGYDA